MRRERAERSRRRGRAATAHRPGARRARAPRSALADCVQKRPRGARSNGGLRESDPAGSGGARSWPRRSPRRPRGREERARCERVFVVDERRALGLRLRLAVALAVLALVGSFASRRSRAVRLLAGLFTRLALAAVLVGSVSVPSPSGGSVSVRLFGGRLLRRAPRSGRGHRAEPLPRRLRWSRSRSIRSTRPPPRSCRRRRPRGPRLRRKGCESEARRQAPLRAPATALVSTRAGGLCDLEHRELPARLEGRPDAVAAGTTPVSSRSREKSAHPSMERTSARPA